VENASSAGSAHVIVVNAKGLKKDAISFFSNICIGIASTAPAYSLASALGSVAGFAAFGTPAVLIVAFVPMLCIAVAYYYLNRSEPDCGTTFPWVTRAMGPHAGWLVGWSTIVTNIIVMPSLAAIAGQYSFQLFGIDDPSALAVTLVGVVWIVAMTGACYLGIGFSARVQQVLLAAEMGVLVIFAVVALFKVYSSSPPADSMHVALNWFNPLGVDHFTEAVLVAVFIYWGWDCGVSVNEETKNPGTAPGQAAVLSTFVLLGIYVLVGAAAVAFAGPDMLAKNSKDIFAPIGESVLGPGLSKLLIFAVLTSACASTLTTILPTARTAVSMAGAGAVPKRFGHIHPRHLSPSFATLVMGAVSIVWYVALTMISSNVLDDSVLALGISIAFYYGLTGIACVIVHRRELFTSVGNFFFIGVLPAVGGVFMLVLFVNSCFSLGSAGSTTIFGVGTPLAIGIGGMLIGFVLLPFVHWISPEFFRRQRRIREVTQGASP